MAEPEDMITFIENDILGKLPLKGKKVMITAGPTYEAIDPVRFIGNHSSGKMGFELARVAANLGAEVILIACYHKEFKKTRTVDYPVFYAKDFGWKGKPKTETLSEFLKTPLDLLISYYSTDTLPLQLVAGLHSANLKIGIHGCDQEIHDMIIQTKITETAIFTKELHKYLHILNKLS